MTDRSVTAWLAMLAGLLSASATLAQIDPAELLPADEAFAISAHADHDGVVVAWDIADGYYLYRHAFRFSSDDALLGTADLPSGTLTHDEFFGETETYRGRVEARLPIADAPPGASVTIHAHSQGCADLGVCYPPQRQTVSFEVPPRAADTAPGGIGSALAQLGAGPAVLADRQHPLPEDQAFGYEAIALDPATLLVRFTPAENYYLYRDPFEFVIEADDDLRVVEVQLPQAEPIHDEYFGDTWVYFDEVEIPIILDRPAGAAQEAVLTASFQGCQSDGICYPPMQRSVVVDLPAAAVASRPATAMRADEAAPARPAAEQDRLAAALGRTPWVALGWFFLAGIALAFTPCVFPMIPILSGLIAGEGERLTTGRAFRLSLVYVLAMALVYTAFGVIAGVFGQNLQAVFQHPAILIGFAGLFVVLSLAMFGFYELQLPARWQTRLSELSNRQQGGTLVSAGIMGALSALIVGPCVAPALMGALIYIGRTGDAVLGGGALFAMALGMGVPLVVWGTSAGKWLPRAGAWMVAVKALFGVGLLALAIWMLERILPPATIMLLWGALAIACAVYLGALTRLEAGVSGWRKLWQALGVMLLVLGVLQFIGAASGARHWSQPLAGLTAGAGDSQQTAPPFAAVASLADLQRALALADGPVFLDFYADWCIDCRRMEVRTFPDPAVAAVLAEFTLLKVDVTDYNDDHRALLEHFGLIGPPAMLFFHRGDELPQFRRFGFMPPQVFVALLTEVSDALPGS